MRKIYLLVALSCYLNLSFGQIDSNTLDKEFFLIGTLDDYMGHQQTFEADGDPFFFQMVDIYYQQEKKLVLLIDSLFKSEYPDLCISNNNASKGLRLYSASLSGKIDQYYDYQPSGRMTMEMDTIYTGYLKKEILKTTNQKRSFLTGFFLRNKVMKNSGKYVLNIANSVRKAELITELLKYFDCKDVEYTVKKNFIPVGHWVSFIPSKEIAEIIEGSQL